MKKILIIVILLLFIVTGCGKTEKFYLEDKYYGINSENESVDLTKDKLEDLIAKKESFALFIYQPLCSASGEFSKVLDEFRNEYQIDFYKMSFSNMKETDLYNDIKYYPSFIIFNKGEMVAYLDANSEEDAKYYKTTEVFVEWFFKYVISKVNVSNSSGNYEDYNSKNNTNNEVEIPPENNEQDNNQEPNIPENNREDAKLENIKYDANKINIYFFWGNGCPHCEAEHAFFDSIEEQYGKYYNLHTFEVWYNQDNANLLNTLAGKMNQPVEGVPFTIIGNKVFGGFTEAYKQDMINAIKNQYKNSYDVYFDN